ncbi:hypothetical protein L5515_015872 [Caenorhabditis briggsae]|uniref:Uncharacterized protein n=1 Tax=Caenorhabditis briggsae TaxID=6238 RepID=A0AAE9J8C5_CAEBR|nr:hypothetical protein L5515_015064 [Caenorhabditis briggsae]UMM20692.1 hypothetical protein L5515_015872 [Caenorhabditis briggsae]
MTLFHSSSVLVFDNFLCSRQSAALLHTSVIAGGSLQRQFTAQLHISVVAGEPLYVTNYEPNKIWTRPLTSLV